MNGTSDPQDSNTEGQSASCGTGPAMPGGMPTARQAREAIGLITAAGYEIAPDDFFLAQVTLNGMEVPEADLGPSVREALDVVRDHIEASEVGDMNLAPDALALAARKCGATPEQAEALAGVHAQLQAGDMPGFDQVDLRELLGADDYASGYLDDLEARVGVDVTALRTALFPDMPAPRPA